MTGHLKKRWIIVTLIWVAALLVTVLNRYKINQILFDRQQTEILKKDRDFWTQNSENINKMLKKWDSAFHHVETLNLGLLAVEDQLAAMAGKNRLSNVKMDVLAEQDTELGIPGDVSFVGPLDGAMAWLKILERDYPFLPIRNLNMKLDESKTQAEFKVSFYYRYKVTGTEDVAM